MLFLGKGEEKKVTSE